LLVGWHDHGTWHMPSILLPDHIIKLVVGNEVHGLLCSVVRRNGTDEADRAIPCGRVIWKEEFMVKGNRAVCARVRFVAATATGMALQSANSAGRDACNEALLICDGVRFFRLSRDNLRVFECFLRQKTLYNLTRHKCAKTRN